MSVVSARGWLASFCPVVLAAGALAAVSCSRSELDFGFNAVPEAPGDGVGEDASAGDLRDATLGEDGSHTPLLPDGAVVATDGASTADVVTDPPATVASALQIDPAHNGTIDDPLLVGPLSRLWSVTLPAPISYPIIARDIVVVVTSYGGDASQAQLFAFHGHTGVPAWGPIDLGTGGPTSATGEFGAVTYENGRVFTTESDGVVRAFDIATGTPLWTTNWAAEPEAYLGSPPTAYGGIVYVEGLSSSTSGGLQAIDEASGDLLWQDQASPDLTLGSDPAVTADGVFVSHACASTSRYDRLAGTQIWSSWGVACASGGGAWTPVVAGGLVYARQDDDVETNIIIPPYIVEVSNGADAGTFLSGSPPAVDDGQLFVVSHGMVSSVDLLGQNTAWSFGDGTLTTPAIVVSGRVFVGSSTGMLYGLDESTGAEVWSDNAGEGFDPLQEGFGNIEPTALAAAGGLLVAPAGTSLVVYGVIEDGGTPEAGLADAADAE